MEYNYINESGETKSIKAKTRDEADRMINPPGYPRKSNWIYKYKTINYGHYKIKT